MRKQQADVGQQSASPAFQGRIVKQMATEKTNQQSSKLQKLHPQRTQDPNETMSVQWEQRPRLLRSHHRPERNPIGSSCPANKLASDHAKPYLDLKLHYKLNQSTLTLNDVHYLPTRHGRWTTLAEMIFTFYEKETHHKVQEASRRPPPGMVPFSQSPISPLLTTLSVCVPWLQDFPPFSSWYFYMYM